LTFEDDCPTNFLISMTYCSPQSHLAADRNHAEKGIIGAETNW